MDGRGAADEIIFQSVTESNILVLPIDTVKHILQSDSSFADYLLDSVYLYLSKYRAVRKIISNHRVEERYTWFCKEYKEILPLVSDRIIASFIDTTPQTLSKVKRLLSTK